MMQQEIGSGIGEEKKMGEKLTAFHRKELILYFVQSEAISIIFFSLLLQR